MLEPTEGNHKILLVDDVQSNIKLMETALAKNNYTLVFANNGPAAIKLAQQVLPDLILLDIMMPEMDGFKVCEKLKTIPETKNIPIIFVTAKITEEDEMRGFELGAIDYITKPIRYAILNARVRTHLELKDKTDRLIHFSTIDDLTGIANHRHFITVFEQSWNHAIRAKESVALMMIDVDFFKRFNDRYGHLRGDDCLSTVASCLVEAMNRSTDFVARYGGEEFVCVLPSTEIGGALAIAEELRKKVENLEVKNQDSAISEFVTISIGVSALVPERGQRIEHIIEKADTALYQAKKDGRNRVRHNP